MTYVYNKTYKATLKTTEKKQLEMKVKRDEIYKYIKSYPGHTVYSISQALQFPMSTVRKLANQLIEFKKITFELKVENNRSKKVFYAVENPIFDATFVYFLFDNFYNEKIGDREKLMAEQALNRGEIITIELPSGETIEVQPGEDLVDVLEKQRFAATSKFT